MGAKNIYFSDHLQKKLEAQAKKQKKSVSALVTEILEKQLTPKDFSERFLGVIGSLDPDFQRPKQGVHDSRDKFDE